SNADPKVTFLRLVPDGALDATFIARVKEWSTKGCVLKVNLALSELPDFVARPGRGPQHHGTIEISPSIDYLHAAYEDATKGDHPRSPPRGPRGPLRLPHPAPGPLPLGLGGRSGGVRHGRSRTERRPCRARRSQEVAPCVTRRPRVRPTRR